MCALEEAARRIERTHPDVWAVNVAAGFAYADTPWTGVSFQIIAGQRTGEVHGLLDELTELTTSLEELGRPAISTIEDAQTTLNQPVDGLTVIVEPSDNIGAGAPEKPMSQHDRQHDRLRDERELKMSGQHLNGLNGGERQPQCKSPRGSNV